MILAYYTPNSSLPDDFHVNETKALKAKKTDSQRNVYLEQVG